MSLKGLKFGKLTIVKVTEKRQKNGSKIIECLCECGNTTYSNITNLKSGRKKSCGCLINAPQKLEGKKFNKLTVLALHENSTGRKWKCLCECGNTTFATTKDLKSGNKKSCGCLKTTVKDLAGMKFGRLTVLSLCDRKANEPVKWLCLCECGNHIEVLGKSLTEGNTKSCGCLQRENPKSKLSNKKHNILGTRVTSLNKTVFSSNTSGIRGVSWNKQKQKWESFIKFQGKQYHLGLYDNLENAKQAREAAEENLWGNFLEWYNTFKNNKEGK